MTVTGDQMRAFLQRKDEHRRTEARRLHAQAAADVARIVELICRRYKPSRIVQWGSVLDADRFRSYSDIDLAVEGVRDPARFFALLADAEEVSRFPLDIVQLEQMEPEYRELVLERGRVVYERDE